MQNLEEEEEEEEDESRTLLENNGTHSPLCYLSPNVNARRRTFEISRNSRKEQQHQQQQSEHLSSV